MNIKFEWHPIVIIFMWLSAGWASSLWGFIAAVIGTGIMCFHWND